MKMIIEPSSAVPVAVALYNEDFRRVLEKESANTVFNLGLVVSGGNVDIRKLPMLLDGLMY